jgi:hypothetical protein
VRVVKRALVDSGYWNLLFELLRQALRGESREYRASWTVRETDIEEPVKAKRLRGLSEKTVRDEARYIRLALSELNWALAPDVVREYLAELAESGEDCVLKHTAYSLKSLLKTILKPRDPGLFAQLYNAFTVYKPRNHSRVKLPTLGQLRAIWK